MIAGKNDAMQRDDWYETSRDPAELAAPETVGRRAGERALKRLGAQKIATTQVPVLFEAPVAPSLLGHFVSAVSGGSLYRKSSFLLDSIGQQVFAPFVHISDLPHIRKALASSPFDDEGVATQARDVVKDGVVQGYFLGSYSARKLGSEVHRQRRRQPQPDSAGHRRRFCRAARENGQRPAGDRTAWGRASTR